MKKLFFILVIGLTFFQPAVFGQKSKNKKAKSIEKGPRVFEVVGDSIRHDSIVYYETEIGYIMPDLSPKFRGVWDVHIMKRQARANPDTLDKSYIEFVGDTLFNASAGCNKISGSYTIKGPTIKFRIFQSETNECSNIEIEQWFLKLLEERVSYFAIDEKALYLKDVANNIVFDCSRTKNEN